VGNVSTAQAKVLKNKKYNSSEWRMNMQVFKQQFLILHAREMTITNRETGEVENEGISIRYIPTSDFSPQVDEDVAARGQVLKGILPAKLWFSKAKASQLKDLPAIYDCEIEMTVMQEKLQARIKNMEHVSNVTLQRTDKKG
jgi:hypothetical protein